MEENFNEIRSLFDRVIRYSQDYDIEIDSSEVFTDWKNNKYDIFSRNLHGLIYEHPTPVTFELDDKSKESRFKEFIDYTEDISYGLNEFLVANQENFFLNQVKDDYLYLGKIIPKGMKIVKAFKYFISDEETLRNLQDAASRIIQENKTTGIFCVSIHPLDYLSASENTHNWRSCHSLDGEYRSGNLSYMTDRCTIMCYLKSEKDEWIPDFPTEIPWNSKKWRMLLHFSNDKKMMFAGRQYPFSSNSALNFIKNLLPSLGFGEWTDWTSEKLKHWGPINYYKGLIPLSDKMIPISELVKNDRYALQYTDVLMSNVYDPQYAYKKDSYGYVTTTGDTRFLIGHGCKCLKCRSKYIYLSESFLCNDCTLEYGNCDSDAFAACPYCGRTFVYDDGVYLDGTDEVVCPSCGDEKEFCKICGREYTIEDVEYDDKGNAICKYCIQEQENY